MKNEELIDLVEGAMKAREETLVPREFILEAINRVASKNESVESYPTGMPSLKGISDLAHRLWNEKICN